jgi:DNA-binding LacI/PurR family transcriptional regulator/signal transduction histidine kinase
MPRRKVIALLTNNPGMRADYQGLMRQGVEQACIERDIDLWVYAGRSDWRPTGPVQAHVYRLISPDRIDGIIIAAGAIAASLSLDEVLALVRERCVVPTCAVGQRCPGVPSVVVENGAGAGALAHHLASVHGHRSFAYIAGPAGHEESDERLHASREALARLGVPLPPEAVIHGNFATISGLEAARELLRRSRAFDALLVANDDMAVGALEALETAGLRCPEDIAVAGFDDAPSSRTSNPPLTTVRQPIVDLGTTAVGRVVAAWEGDGSADLVTLDTELILRESCGCRHGAGVGSGLVPNETPDDRVAEALGPLLSQRSQRAEWARALCQAADAEQRGELGALRGVLQALIEHLPQPDAPIHEVSHVIGCLRAIRRPGGITPELESAFHEALARVGQTMHRREGKRRLYEEDLTEKLRANWERLASSLDLPALRGSLEVQMPALSILNAFVGMYARDDQESLVPVACVTDGRSVEIGVPSYPARWLLPAGALDTKNRCSLSVLPLTFEWQPLGVAVLELPRSHELYAVLREQIGSAIKTMQLYQDMLQQAKLSAQAQEEKRATAERLRSLGLIAGGVAHDLNNVLGPLVGLPEALSHDLRESSSDTVPGRVFDDLETLRQAGERAAETIRDLATLGQPNVGPKATLDLSLLLAKEGRTIAALGERRQSVTVQIETSDVPLLVHASKPHLLRAISNLVLNAADAIDGPGSISVRASAVVLAEPRRGIENIEPGSYAVVEVADTGAGIPRENLGRIMEPFFTSRPFGRRRGTGLGLAIVHRIVKDSRGFVDVESTVDEGTRISLYFPLLSEGGASESSRPATAMGGSERILVVDDEPVQLRTARRILERLGYHVTTAPSGDAALALVRNRLPGNEFQLVILDMMMPDMDGLRTLANLRAVHPRQKALIVTGYTPLEVDRASADVEQPWLAKPYTPAALGRAVRRALDS